MWYSFIISALGYIWNLFLDWLRTIFIVPFKTTDMLWLLVPVWIAWVFAEFFQEKRETSLGNAISNAVIILWGSIDCARQTSYYIARHPGIHTGEILLRFFLIILLFSYGALIIWLGIKANSLIKYIGRIREVTYVFVIFVPIFYGAIPLTFNHVLGAILFFPVFYYVIELLDYIIPDPKAIQIDSVMPSNLVASSPDHEHHIKNQNKNQYPKFDRKY